MTLDYYYDSQADQSSFIRIPRILLTEEMFSSLTLQSKMLYSILLDRMSISMKNGWFDEENWAYIIYQISEIQKDLGFSKKKAMDYLAELEKFGLVEKKKRGFGLPSIIYVKSFLITAGLGILMITWLVVHILVSIFSIFHGFWKVFFILFIILALAFGMWQNTVIFIMAITITFTILIAGISVDVILEEARKRIGRQIGILL